MVTSKRTLQEKLFWGFVLITAFAIIVPAILSRNSLYDEYLTHIKDQSLSQASLIKSLLENDPSPTQIEALLTSVKANGNRLTIISADGKALHDSHLSDHDVERLDNHNDRPEVEEARTTGKGISTRYSNTLGFETVYTAIPFGDGTIIRMALPLAEIHLDFANRYSTLGVTFIIATIICLITSMFITRKVRKGVDSMAEVVAFIAKNKGGNRLTRIPGKEFLPLAFAVNQMADNIEEYIATTTDQRTQLEIILNSVHEGILVLSPTGTIRRFNTTLVTLFPDVVTALEKHVIEGIPIPELQHTVDEFLGKKSIHTPTLSEETLHFEHDGNFFVVHLSLPVEPSQSVGAVLVIYNATTLMRLERVRRDFIANISHELRTPLTAISGYAETLLGMNDLSDDQKKFATIIYKHANGLAKVIHDLLALTRIENNQETIVMEPLSPAIPCTEAIKLCSPQAGAKRLQFTVDMPDKGLNILGNMTFLTQVFRNLLENACRYSPEGGTVVITAHKRGNEMLFAVKDQGPGIAPHELSQIFERLYQVNKERNSGFSGIGLAICKHIITLHKGAIWAESPYEGYSTAMLFTIPLEELTHNSNTPA